MKVELPLPPIRVMLVDDHEHVLWALSRLVNGEYPTMHVVGSARTVTETIIGLRHWQPEVLVVSDSLAGESGIEALPRFQASYRTAIVVLTTLRDARLSDRALQFGAQATFVKGDDAVELLAGIEGLARFPAASRRAARARAMQPIGELIS
jgi:two-component system, NarL family, nitrate/nitrite response regulator NarL